ncbi:DUF5988 family protein [Streptomyces puniciscabiei]
MTAARDSVERQPNIILRGGPMESAPLGLRLRYTADRTDKYKLFMGNCYEHFVPAAETVLYGGEELQVFDWSGRTYVAE